MLQKPESELRVLLARRTEVSFAIPLGDIAQIGRLPRASPDTFVLRGVVREVIEPPCTKPSDVPPSMFIALRHGTRCFGVDEVLGLMDGREEEVSGKARFVYQENRVLPLLKNER